MNTSILNFTIVKTPNTKYSDAQIFLQEFTGNSFSRPDAEMIWSKVIDHKWNISENLKRDVGLRVAAVDFLENFYAPSQQRKTDANNRGFFRRTKSLVRAFFKAIRQSINY